jgi:hypothetical protein
MMGGIGDVPRKSGSQPTHNWRKADSNFWSRERKYFQGNTSLPGRRRPNC